MGLCHSNGDNSENKNKLGIIEGIRDIPEDYLIKESIKFPIETKYKIQNCIIGQGSSGPILLGEDESGKRFAIKSIEKASILKDKFLLNEIKIALKVKHPNILEMKEIYENKKTISCVMEYCQMGDLLNFIKNNQEGKLDNLNTIDILVQILDALNYLHNEVNICHRDLKPNNILIIRSPDNRLIVKIIDFGLAGSIFQKRKMKAKIGTLIYMAPEIIKNNSYDEKIDIWSTGMILYNMTTGCGPFVPGNNERIKYQILNKPIDFYKITNEDLRELCKEMLERNSEKRINTRTALERAIMIKRKILNEE